MTASSPPKTGTEGYDDDDNVGASSCPYPPTDCSFDLAADGEEKSRSSPDDDGDGDDDDRDGPFMRERLERPKRIRTFLHAAYLGIAVNVCAELFLRFGGGGMTTTFTTTTTMTTTTTTKLA